MASSSVGKPAIRSAPKTRSGRSRRRLASEADHVVAQVPALHPLEHEVVARLDRQVQVRQQPRLVGHQLAQVGVDRGRVERGQPQPPQLGHLGQEAP